MAAAALNRGWIYPNQCNVPVPGELPKKLVFERGSIRYERHHLLSFETKDDGGHGCHVLVIEDDLADSRAPCS
jgi:hypothetical protein